jgi:4-amino-4-deoxy-L-arabinose transferase-like glycosyltransferase
LGAYRGFYAAGTHERVRGYLLMHAALGIGFLCKSAVAWMVPALALVTLALWERRWRELLRWELYVGLALQAAMILTWIGFVYAGPDGPAHLKVFFWNNLVGRFTRVDAPNELQYAAAHRNSPGKYLIELPLYLAPWTFLVAAAARRAWRQRKSPLDDYRAVRFALAASLPSLAVLSLAATARNVYLAPALPGAALLLAWWAREIQRQPDPWDLRALRATSMLLLLAVLAFAAALCAIGVDSWDTLPSRADFIAISAAGLIVAAALALRARSATPAQSATPADTPARAAASISSRLQRAQWSLLLAYCTLLVGPASQVYSRVDTWQDLASVARGIEKDAAGKPLILFAPDETTRAMIDMYARTGVALIPGPIDSGAILRLRAAALAAPQSFIVVQIRGRSPLRGRLQDLARRWNFGSRPREERAPAADAESELTWLPNSGFRLAMSYSLPNGRRYALLALRPDGA